MKSINVFDQNVIEVVIAVLESSGIVIFPTETTYGAGVDATNPSAVAKLLKFKSRREGKPLSIAVPDLETAQKYVDVNDQAKILYQQFLPGPVTIVSNGLQKVAPGVESEFGTLGVRIPDYSFVLELLKKFGKPITATSANPSGGKRPYAISDVMESLSEKQKSLIDLVIDAGTLPPNPPSTVIDTTLSTPVTLRQGAPKITADTSNYTLNSKSEAETKQIAGKLLLKYWTEIGDQGLVIALDGALGVGKTIFAKGLAEFLQISETITSPTYSYIQEFDFVRHQTKGNFYHLDMWKVDSREIFDKLQIEKLIGPGKVVVIEWFSQVAEYFEKITLLKASANLPMIYLDIDAVGQDRTLKIYEKN